MISRVAWGLCSIVCLAILALAGCGGHSSDTVERASENDDKSARVSTHFAVFLVQDVRTEEAIKSNIATIRLHTEAVLTHDDLIAYNWQDHELRLSADFDLGRRLGRVPLDGLPFVVVADDARVYIGAFWTPISSFGVSIPVIIVPMVPNGPLRIDVGYPGSLSNGQHDPRSDPRIYQALRYVGKLREQ